MAARPTVQTELICEQSKKCIFCPVQPDGKVACAMNYKIITHSTVHVLVKIELSSFPVANTIYDIW